MAVHAENISTEMRTDYESAVDMGSPVEQFGAFAIRAFSQESGRFSEAPLWEDGTRMPGMTPEQEADWLSQTTDYGQ